MIERFIGYAVDTMKTPVWGKQAISKSTEKHHGDFEVQPRRYPDHSFGSGSYYEYIANLKPTRSILRTRMYSWSFGKGPYNLPQCRASRDVHPS